MLILGRPLGSLPLAAAEVGGPLVGEASVGVGASAALQRRISDTLTQNLTTSGNSQGDRRAPLGLGVSVGVTSDASRVFRGAATAAGVVRVSELPGVQHTLTPTITQTLRITPQVRWSWSLLVGDAVSVSVTDVVTRALKVADHIRASSALVPALSYGTAVGDVVRVTDVLRLFLGAAATDSLGITPALVTRLRVSGALASTAGVTDVAFPAGMVLRVEVQGNVQMTEAAIRQWVLGGEVVEGVRISAVYLAPDGGMVAFAINTATAAVTEYKRYEFTSMTRAGRRYLGVSPTGLYTLDGDTDDGEDIIARVAAGLHQFSGSKFTSFQAAYLGMAATGDVLFKVRTGDAKEYVYRVVVQPMATTKVRIGKGVRARYFGFELETLGQDFDLDTVEFLPVTAQRRV